MTKRFLYPITWAQDGTATDPDLDTTAPSYEPDRYETKGWHSEKPPEEWQNFLTQISDQKIVELIISGIAEKDASVTYQDGALYQDGGKIYVVVGGAGQEVLTTKDSEFVSFVQGLNTTLNNHLATDNPHNDTVDTLTDKTYLRETVDNLFGSPTDPATIVYHKARTGAGVHGETPAQLGTLPTSGGTFSGAVVMERDAIVNLSPSKLLHLNRSTAIFELASGTMSIGIATNGRCWFTDSSGTYEIMTEANYADFQIRWNNRFALPLPYLDMHLADSLSDADSVGSWMVVADNTPVFHANGGVKVDDNNITFQNFNIDNSCDIYVIGRTSTGARVITLSTGAPSANYTSMNTLLTNVGLTTAAYVERIVVYERLSNYQKSMLVL